MTTTSKMKVVNLKSGKGNTIANQFEITAPGGRYFQSYRSMIVFIPAGGGKTQLDAHYWDYSKTTGKYRNLFLGENKAATEAKIKSGEYILTDLN